MVSTTKEIYCLVQVTVRIIDCGNNSTGCYAPLAEFYLELDNNETLLKSVMARDSYIESGIRGTYWPSCDFICTESRCLQRGLLGLQKF